MYYINFKEYAYNKYEDNKYKFNLENIEDLEFDETIFNSNKI